MPDFSDFADKLQQEVVTDMAETYFGDRKNLDEMIAAFYSMVEEFRAHGPALWQAAARLHCLLLDRKTARDFYIALDILPSCIPFSDEVARPFFDSLPFALTPRGRYERCVFRAYSTFQQVADEYLNGRYYTDTNSHGRKRLTLHYIRLKALAEHINEEVGRVNKTLSPSATLRYIKKMDPDQVERENVMGEACLIDGCELDTDLRFAPIDFDALKLPVVQDLPRLDAVKPAIRQFCKEIYPTRKNDIIKAMASLRDGQ